MVVFFAALRVDYDRGGMYNSFGIWISSDRVDSICFFLPLCQLQRDVSLFQASEVIGVSHELEFLRVACIVLSDVDVPQITCFRGGMHNSLEIWISPEIVDNNHFCRSHSC